MIFTDFGIMPTTQIFRLLADIDINCTRKRKIYTKRPKRKGEETRLLLKKIEK